MTEEEPEGALPPSAPPLLCSSSRAFLRRSPISSAVCEGVELSESESGSIVLMGAGPATLDRAGGTEEPCRSRMESG